MIGVPITTFTQLELAGNKIRYIHNSDDEMKMDSFEFEVTDGFNPVARTFRISLSDVDNRKPVLMFQTLRLKEGDQKLITPFELSAEDRDTPDESIVFTVTQVSIVFVNNDDNLGLKVLYIYKTDQNYFQLASNVLACLRRCQSTVCCCTTPPEW